jgi:hypothetical protein
LGRFYSLVPVVRGVLHSRFLALIEQDFPLLLGSRLQCAARRATSHT